MSELVPGGNTPLPGGPVSMRVPGAFDVSALVTDDGGKVGGDEDFVFYNQPDAPGARLRGDTLTVDPARLRSGATRVTVVVSCADPGTVLNALPSPTLRVADAGGRALARFTPPRPGPETVLLLAELYRRGGGWKLRALGQGYADGLAGLARDFGVEVTDESRPEPGTAPAPSARSSGSAPDADGFLDLVNSARAAAGSPPVRGDSRLVSAARAHSAAMAAAGALSVETRDGIAVHQRVVSAGFAYLTVGEHLVSGPRTPAEFVAYCLRTERTRRTLHDAAFTHAGWAHVTGGPTGGTFWTALWAVPLTPDGLARTTAEVLTLTNRERAGAGLPALAPDDRLARAAQAHSADMVARDFYSHTDPDGGRPWDRAAAAGSSRRTVGENIACGQRSPAEVVEGWMNSPGHRANILTSDFTHLGVGLAGGGRAGTYWTQLFGG
ncbi:TerD family protein [Streptomyces olivaceus]|uniref:CAP domain-containing protein n=1 Tax=Streptomyces olivaceus TaxID=47716 RepID=UPI001CC8F113|nr:CAP domain-containing protein [Streptomyces olivaceus]MBZ6176115.1 TerD family protein [Streptomyces olivaceus]MBZ6182685.1 TerD family protein [Streptomyces olivaceus]